MMQRYIVQLGHVCICGKHYGFLVEMGNEVDFDTVSCVFCKRTLRESTEQHIRMVAMARNN